MTTEEAIAVAIAAAIDDQTQAQAHPQRQRFDKLQRHHTAAAQHSAGVTELAKNFGELGSTIADMNKRIAQLAADVEFLKISHEEHPNSPRRLQ